MPTIVAVAGGSNGLGRALINVFRADPRYDPIILSRNANPKLEQETGVRVVAADYSNPDALRALLEEHNISAVLSTMQTVNDPNPELNLVEAANKSKVTKRFIPNVWSMMMYKPEHIKGFPVAVLRFQVMDALKATELEWAAIYPGIFMDYYVINIPTYIAPTGLCVDVFENVAGLPGDGTTPVHTTWSEDIGRYVAELLSLDKWAKQSYYTAGDAKSFKELVELVEKKKGVKFNVSYDPIEKLQKGEVTELPSHKKAYEAYGGEAMKPFLKTMFATASSWIAAGETTKRENADSLNDLFPEVKPLSLEAAWEKFYKAK